MLRSFRVYSLTNFHMYCRAVLTVAIALYITSLVFLYLVTGSWYLWTTFLQSLLPTPPASSTQIWSLFLCIWLVFSVFLLFSDSTYKWGYTVFVFIWLISLIVILLKSIHFVSNGKVSLCYYGWIILHCIYMCVYVCVYIYLTTSLSVLSVNT